MHREQFMMEPAQIVHRQIWWERGVSSGNRSIPEETAVALTYNGGTYAVMMATPQLFGGFRGIRRQLKASLRPGVLPEAATMPDWHRGLRLVSLLVARTSGTRPYRAADAASLREAVQKNDAADAEAFCEAATRATMRFVPTKTPEQQSCLMLHRTRHLFIRQQTAVINSIRAHLAEFGIVAPVGRKGVTELLHVVADPSDKRVPEVARACLAALGTQLLSLKQQIVEFDRMIMAWHRSNQTSKRLHYIPGVGPMLATALVASVADPRTFRSGRNFSAWIGLVPKQHSSGGKDRLGSISKQGDRYQGP
jgi:Transposase IS116/IS110/IS902 family